MFLQKSCSDRICQFPLTLLWIVQNCWNNLCHILSIHKLKKSQKWHWPTPRVGQCHFWDFVDQKFPSWKQPVYPWLSKCSGAGGIVYSDESTWTLESFRSKENYRKPPRFFCNQRWRFLDWVKIGLVIFWNELCFYQVIQPNQLYGFWFNLTAPRGMDGIYGGWDIICQTIPWENLKVNCGALCENRCWSKIWKKNFTKNS